MPLNPGDHLGRFLIRRHLDSGATSAVYEAEDEEGERVALKVLHREHEGESDILGRFVGEARPLLSRSLKHPGLPRIFALEIAGDPIYLAMELLGPSLRTRLKEGPLPLPQALTVMIQLAEVLAYLHSREIIHRDVKPANVLFVPEAAGLAVKLIDLGQAKLAPAERLALGLSTAQSSRNGTPEYRAPEQWVCAKSVSDRADVYSLGVILYEVLAGRPPFQAERTGLLRLAHATQEPPDGPGPPALHALCAAMLAKQAPERPSAAAVAQTLRAFAATR